jgi:hypothetical protein
VLAQLDIDFIDNDLDFFMEDHSNGYSFCDMLPDNLSIDLPTDQIADCSYQEINNNGSELSLHVVQHEPPFTRPLVKEQFEQPKKGEGKCLFYTFISRSHF